MDRSVLLPYLDDNSILLEGPEFDSAIVGVTEKGNCIYSYDKLIEVIVTTQKITEDDAIEYIDYNISETLGNLSKYGQAPIIMYEIQ